MTGNSIVVEFDVGASPDHAFEVWTTGTARWWPRAHTVTEDRKAEIVFEPHVGGRIYERGTDGTEHDWGQVIGWDPPNRVEYRWHIFLEPSQATTVTVTFTSTREGARVRLEQRGFEVFGDQADSRIKRVKTGWDVVTGDYRVAIAP